jgi:hypothetical protein
MILKFVKSIDDYLNITNEIRKNQQLSWFRGHEKVEYRLLPSLYREFRILGDEFKNKDGKFHRKSDAIMKNDLSAVEKFKCHYKRIYGKSDLSFVEYLYLMQLYDIPTRLLDFSTDELVALYFSLSTTGVNQTSNNPDDEIEEFIENRGYLGNGACVFSIDPIWTNKKAAITDDIIDMKDATYETLNKIDLPFCIGTSNNNERIIAQKGVFVLFGYVYHPHDYYEILSDKTYKIFVPNSCKEKMFLELKERFNISHSTIFPDMKGISLEIKDEIEEKYKNDCSKIFN